MKIDFTKMHGLGNDFVIIDAREQSVDLTFDQRVKIADRHFGVGCDQLIILEPSEKADVFMRIYNPDGSEAQACGNATRCVARLLIGNNKKVDIETIDRVLPCWVLNQSDILSQIGFVYVNMGKANSYKKINLGREYKDLPNIVAEVNVGNPHCIFFSLEDVEAIDLEHWGPKVENHRMFRERTNVEFVSKIKNEDDTFRVRVWERGAGITKACGSGAMAIAWALKEEGFLNDTVTLRMDGGDLLLTINNDGDVIMIGQTTLPFTGQILEL